MKKVAILITFFFICKSSFAKQSKYDIIVCKADTLPTAQLISFLSGMNVTSYYGKPVDSFLVAIPANFYNLKVYGGTHSYGAMRRAQYLAVDFTTNPYGPGVHIYVSEYTHMDRYSSTGSWDVNLFRKEKIDRIEVWKNQNTCINGSCVH